MVRNHVGKYLFQANSIVQGHAHKKTEQKILYTEYRICSFRTDMTHTDYVSKGQFKYS